MRSLIQEIALRINVPPEKAEEAVSSIVIRVRAALETIGEAKIEGLGTFRMVDGNVTFEIAREFANEINKEFADMKPVALTATGESVAIDDSRAFPGVETAAGDGAGSSDESETEIVEKPLADPLPELDEERAPSEAPPVASETPQETTFESPPPPRPSKVRVPPRERRSSRGRKHEGRPDDFPDMESVVTTRPVQPIHSGVRKRGRSGMPLLVAAAVVVIGLASWLIFGTGEDRTATEAETPAMNAPAADPDQGAPATAISEQEPAPPKAEAAVETAAVSPEPPAGEAGEQAGETPETPLEAVTATSGTAAEQQTAAEAQVVSAGSSAPAEPEPAAAESEPAAVEPERTPAPDGPQAGPVYAWIVASYPSQAEAGNRRDELVNSGLDASVYEATVHGQPAYRVGVGQFGSEADALKNHEVVPPNTPDAWITRVK